MREQKVPRGLRNHNPLNIKLNKNNRWVGLSAVQLDKVFVQFRSPEYGWRAAFIIMWNYYWKYGWRTIREVVTHWAPKTENDTECYIDMVCRHTMIPAQQDLGSMAQNPGKWQRVALAMAYIENGRTDIEVMPMLQGFDMALTAVRGSTYEAKYV